MRFSFINSLSVIILCLIPIRIVPLLLLALLLSNWISSFRAIVLLIYPHLAFYLWALIRNSISVKRNSFYKFWFCSTICISMKCYKRCKSLYHKAISHMCVCVVDANVLFIFHFVSNKISRVIVYLADGTAYIRYLCARIYLVVDVIVISDSYSRLNPSVLANDIEKQKHAPWITKIDKRPKWNKYGLKRIVKKLFHDLVTNLFAKRSQSAMAKKKIRIVLTFATLVNTN